MTRIKISTIGLVALLFPTANAQRAIQPNGSGTPYMLQRAEALEPEDRPMEAGSRGGGATVIWTEDFSNGLAGTNPSGAWTTTGPNGNIWVINTTAPTGAFTPANQRIQSTTFANGFAKFASDSANCTWSGSTPTALPTAQFTAWEGSLVSPVIDLSTTPFVEIEYQQRSRYCCSGSPFYLEISSDGGLTWPTALLSNEGLSTNQDPTFTETRRFSIATAIAEDPSNVRFRFHHNSDAGTSHYFWQVDDIKIRTLPEYEMTMNYGYTSTTGLGEEYGRIPIPQLPATMNVGAEIYNYGSEQQTNVTVTCTVTNAGGDVVFTNTANVGDMASGAIVVTDEDATLPTLPTGLYTATFTINSDQIDQDTNPADNSKVRTFEVTDHVYSLDNLGNHPTGTQTTAQTGTASFANNPEGVKLMTMYMVNQPMSVTALAIRLGNNSRAGGSIVISILDTADVIASPSVVTNPVNGIESDPFVLTAAHISAGGVTIPFPTPVNLPVGGYFATATLTGTGTTGVTTDPEVYITDDTTVPQPGRASAIWLPYDINAQGQEGPHFYGNGIAWAIRLVSDPTVSVAETKELQGISMYPNPTNGILRINGEGSTRYTVEVMNALGEQVQTTSFMANAVLDLSTHSAGVYTVRVSDGPTSTTQRVVLK